jgi:hypothetical protein
LVFLHLRDPEEAQRQRVQFVADPAAAQRNEERLLEAERQRQGRYLAVLHQQIRTDTTLESKMQKGDTLDDF